MNLGLLAPLGLVALAALLLPVLLHLARRTPQRRTEFAALRWLAARLRPRRRIRIEEPWLLLLRLLLVACVALLFARPVWTQLQAGSPWVLVHPGVAAADARTRVDCDQDCEWRWLAPGFPALDRAPADANPPTASLLREADAMLPTGTRLTVVVPRELDGLDAERPRLARPVAWTVAPGRMRASLFFRPSPLMLALHGGPTGSGERYLRAAARANGWRMEAGDAKPPRASVRVLLWLDAAPPSPAVLEWVRAGGTLWIAHATPAPRAMDRVAWRDAAGEAVATEAVLGRGRLLQWQRELAPEALPLLLEPAFARGLADVLAPPAPAASRAPAEALRPRTGAAAYAPPPRPLDGVLFALAIALFAAERWLATRRGRSAAP